MPSLPSSIPNPSWGDDNSDRLGYDGAGRMITKRYLAGGIDGENRVHRIPQALLLVSVIVLSAMVAGCGAPVKQSADLAWLHRSSDINSFNPRFSDLLLQLAQQDMRSSQYSRAVSPDGETFEDELRYDLLSDAIEEREWQRILQNLTANGFVYARGFPQPLHIQVDDDTGPIPAKKYAELENAHAMAIAYVDNTTDTPQAIISIRWPKELWRPTLGHAWDDEDASAVASVQIPSAIRSVLSGNKAILLTLTVRFSNRQWSSRIVTWDVPTGIPRRTFIFDGKVRDLSIAPDGESFAIITDEGQLRHVKWRSGHIDEFIVISNALACAFHTSSALLVSDTEHKVYVIDLVTGKSRDMVDSTKLASSPLAVSPDGSTVLICTSDNTVQHLVVRNDVPVLSMPFEQGVDLLVVAPNNMYVAGASGSSLMVYDISTGRLVLRTNADTAITCIQFSPCSKFLAIGTIGEIRLADIVTPKWERIIRTPIGGAAGLHFSCDGEWLAYLLNRDAIRCCRWTTGEEGNWWTYLRPRL